MIRKYLYNFFKEILKDLSTDLNREYIREIFKKELESKTGIASTMASIVVSELLGYLTVEDLEEMIQVAKNKEKDKGYYFIGGELADKIRTNQRKTAKKVIEDQNNLIKSLWK